MRTVRTTMVIAVLALGWLAPGCAHFRPPEGYGSAPAARDEAAPQTCEELAHIEDADDGDSQTLRREGRGGYVYTYADELGSTIWPASDAFQPSEGGVEGVGHALRIHGTVAEGGGDLYAGVGFSLVAPAGPYDASRYRGLSFTARKAPGSSGFVRLKLPDVNTVPEGGRCTECYNDFGVDFEVSDEWTRYVVDFADLTQESGWGEPRTGAVDATALYGIQWQVSTPGAQYDLWFDDVTFLGCPDEPDGEAN